MKAISFHPNFTDVNIKDLQNFITYVFEEEKFRDVNIQVMTYSREDDHSEYDFTLNTRITITFFTYCKREDGTRKTEHWRWHSNRAKNFCCNNMYFENSVKHKL